QRREVVKDKLLARCNSNELSFPKRLEHLAGNIKSKHAPVFYILRALLFFVVPSDEFFAGKIGAAKLWRLVMFFEAHHGLGHNARLSKEQVIYLFAALRNFEW